MRCCFVTNRRGICSAVRTEESENVTRYRKMESWAREFLETLTAGRDDTKQPHLTIIIERTEEDGPVTQRSWAVRSYIQNRKEREQVTRCENRT